MHEAGEHARRPAPAASRSCGCERDAATVDVPHISAAIRPPRTPVTRSGRSRPDRDGHRRRRRPAAPRRSRRQAADHRRPAGQRRIGGHRGQQLVVLAAGGRLLDALRPAHAGSRSSSHHGAACRRHRPAARASVAMPSERSIIAVATVASARSLGQPRGHRQGVAGSRLPAQRAADDQQVAGPAAAAQHRPLGTAERRHRDHQHGRPREVAAGQRYAVAGQPGGQLRHLLRTPRAGPARPAGTAAAAPIAARSDRLAAAARWPIARASRRSRSEVHAVDQDVRGGDQTRPPGPPRRRRFPPAGRGCEPATARISSTSSSSGSMAANVPRTASSASPLPPGRGASERAGRDVESPIRGLRETRGLFCRFGGDRAR